MSAEAEDIGSCALRLIARTIIESAKFVAVTRQLALKSALRENTNAALRENALLRSKIRQLESLVEILRGQLTARRVKRHLTWSEKFQIIWHMYAFNITKRDCGTYFTVARSTLDRWLRRGLSRARGGNEPANKTPEEVSALVRRIFRENKTWGKLRIAQQLAVLKIFIAASTVRNILHRPAPKRSRTKTAKGSKQLSSKPTSVKRTHPAATRPNEVVSVDLTTTKLWWFWPVHILVGIDHFSRKVIAAVPLRKPDTASVIVALGQAFKDHGTPRLLVSDHGSVFTAKTFKRFLKRLRIKQRLGAVGQPRSIAVTERVIGELKREWLRRVVLIRGIDHLRRLCTQWLDWHNSLRPHQALSGNRPCDVHREGRIVPFAPDDRSKHKRVPPNIEVRIFRDTHTRARRLKHCA